MGADFLSGCGDRGDPVDLVAFCRVLTEEISSGELISYLSSFLFVAGRPVLWN